MPKRLMLIFAPLSLMVAIAACNNSSSVSPTPVPSFSPTPNPQITAVYVEVTILGTPAPHVAVDESTPNPKTTDLPGVPFATHTTGPSGQTKFGHLKPSATYCWVAHLGGGSTAYQCYPWQDWQGSKVIVGT